MATNPTRAINAILSAPTQVGEYTIYPLTIARMAILDRIGSPMVTGINDMVRAAMSLWVMTKSTAELLPVIDNPKEIQNTALQWIDGIDLKLYEQLCAASNAKFDEFSSLMADDQAEDDKKKQPTDG